MAASRTGLTVPELREGLTACLAVPRWVDQIMAGLPYPSMLHLLDAAAAAANPLTVAEVDQALTAHPRISEQPTGDDLAADFSRDERASSASDDAGLAAALAEGGRAYEERFGRIFLIRAAGRDGHDILAELHRRLALDPASEMAVVASELRDIALLRIPKLFDRLDAPRADPAG